MNKSMWVTSWDLTSKERISQIVTDAEIYGFKNILAEIRYRGDALYQPNRIDSTFSNPEPRSFLLSDSLNFDPLAYLIEEVKDKNIKVYAWFTTFVATTRDTIKLPDNHVFYLHPEWITHDFQKRTMPPNSHEGAFLDPGIPAVKNYLLNIIMDIAVNYSIAGIHLDYIRYPAEDFGYSQISRQQYEFDTHYEDPHTWQEWKIEQISSFVRQVSVSLRNLSSELELSAAVSPDLESAKTKYSQNWFEWLARDYVDHLYLMVYTKDLEIFTKTVERAANLGFTDKFVIGLRAWDYSNNYPVSAINKKLKICKDNRFNNVSFFSYSGLKNQNYLGKIKD